MSNHSGLAFVMMALFAGCSPRSDAAAKPDLTVVRVQLDSLWAAYNRAAQAGDAARLAAFYSDSAYLVMSGTPTLHDRATVEALTAEALKGGRFVEDVIHPELTEWVGDRVMQMGSYHDVFEAAGKPAQTTFGRFSAMLQRDATGGWIVSRLAAIQDSSIARNIPGTSQ